MNQSMTGQLTKFYEAAYVDLPLAAAQRWMGGNRKSLEVAGWAAYDSFVALANELTNRMYANPLVAASFGRALETAFHVQHIFDAFTPSTAPLLPEPSRLDSSEPAESVAEFDEAPRVTLATRSAHYAEAAAQYRTAAWTRRPRRAVAA